MLIGKYYDFFDELTRRASVYGYSVNCLYPNYNALIPRCSVDHFKKIISVPKPIRVGDLYSFAHEIGHAKNVIEQDFNTEELAWDVARTICEELNIPMCKFDEYKNKCLKTYCNDNPSKVGCDEINE